jgi:hypothetical protein
LDRTVMSQRSSGSPSRVAWRSQCSVRRS